jgi:thiol-disulfide isomerase/thioredoxin
MRSSMKTRLKLDAGKSRFGQIILRAWIFVCALALLLTARAQEPAALYGYGLNGAPIDQLYDAGTKLVVLFFTATDCPISNRYIPEIERLQKQFAADGAIFWYDYPNLGETAKGVRQHEVAYGAEEHVLLDPQHRLVELARAKVTPEVAILVPDGASPQGFRVVYRGRIDNRYIHFGVQRPAATQHDLEEAIADVLHHQPVHQPDGPPVGCSIIGQP